MGISVVLLVGHHGALSGLSRVRSPGYAATQLQEPLLTGRMRYALYYETKDAVVQDAESAETMDTPSLLEHSEGQGGVTITSAERPGAQPRVPNDLCQVHQSGHCHT